jgi:hypothetical protein
MVALLCACAPEDAIPEQLDVFLIKLHIVGDIEGRSVGRCVIQIGPWARLRGAWSDALSLVTSISKLLDAPDRGCKAAWICGGKVKTIEKRGDGNLREMPATPS